MCHLLALLGSANIVVVSRLRVNVVIVLKVRMFTSEFKAYVVHLMKAEWSSEGVLEAV
jgi:hypothetical protein